MLRISFMNKRQIVWIEIKEYELIKPIVYLY